MRGVLSALSILVVAGVAAVASFDVGVKTLVQIDYHTQHKNWEQVLKTAEKLKVGYASTITAVNRALYHTGRLPYDMFAFPQVAGHKLLYPEARGYRMYMKMSDLLFELGHVNYAEKWAFEALEVGGDRPSTVRRLALICVLKGRTEAARTFLHFLSRNPLYGKWAKQCLRDLENDPLLWANEEVTRVRALMVNRDQCSPYLPTDVLLGSLLKANKHNRMAFEYLMAHYLLSRQHDKCAENIGRLDDFDYSGIPPLYEEAVLLHAMKTRKKMDLGGRRIRLATFERVEAFTRFLQEFKGDKAKAIVTLAEDYGDTYVFFLTYGTSAARSSSARTGARK